MRQLTLDFGPEPFRFLYTEAANDPVYDSSLFRRAQEKRKELTSAERSRLKRSLFIAQRGRCAACALHCSRCGHLELDHWVALINGGDNSASNFRLICQPCHRLKTSRDLALSAARRRPALTASRAP